MLYLVRCRAVLDDVAQDIVRVRIWLETDRQVHWKRQIRLRGAEASQAEAELVTARLSGDTGAIMDRRRALAKARDALHQAEESRDRVRRWLQRYATDVEAHGVLPRRLQQVLSHDGSRAVNFLESAATILMDYAAQGTGPAAHPGAEPAPQNAEAGSAHAMTSTGEGGAS